MPGRILVGMSGFSYPEWVGHLYPSGTKRNDFLARYADRFEAVEINMTFRRQPQETTLVKWRETVSADFRFALKAHQRITHHKRLVDVADDLDFFVRNCRPLHDRLGPLLFQTPPTLAYDRELFERFLEALPPVVAHAFEPRHPSFASPEVDELLAVHRVARCVNDDLFDPASYRLTGPVAYLRFRRDDYTPAELEERASQARRLAADGTDVYVFFKHEGDPAGVHLALRFRELVTDAS